MLSPAKWLATSVPEKALSENVPPTLVWKNSKPLGMMLAESALKTKVKTPEKAVVPTEPFPTPVNV